MIGLIYLIFFLLYGWLSWRLVKWAARRAKARGASPWLWGGAAGLVMYSLVFWDWLPMEVAFRYDCARHAGFTQYKTLAQWKAENPGVAETLTPSGDLKSFHEGNRERYLLNQRFAWDIIQTPHGFHIREREERIVDTRTGEVLARYVDFDTDIPPIGLGIKRSGAFKIWMMKRSCEADRNSKKKFNEFYHLVKYQEEIHL